MSDLRLGKFWDRALEGGLPDCRLRHGERERDTVMHGRMPMEKVYCAQCLQWRGGAVTAGWVPHVFFVCDDCFYKTRKAPEGTVEIADSLVQR